MNDNDMETGSSFALPGFIALAVLVYVGYMLFFHIPTKELGPVSELGKVAAKSELLKPYPISNPPLLWPDRKDPRKLSPVDLSQLRGEWVFVFISPRASSPMNYGGGTYPINRRYPSAVKRHFIENGVKPPHISTWRLDDLRGYETALQPNGVRRLDRRVTDMSMAITSTSLKGLGNSFNRPFMHWIGRNQEAAMSNRDTSRDPIRDPHLRLGSPHESYPIGMIIDPEGFVQWYWRGNLPHSYAIYLTIREMQAKYAEAKKEQARIDGSELAQRYLFEEGNNKFKYGHTLKTVDTQISGHVFWDKTINEGLMDVTEEALAFILSAPFQVMEQAAKGEGIIGQVNDTIKRAKEKAKHQRDNRD